MPALPPYAHLEVKAIATRAIGLKGNIMSATTVFGQVGTDQISTHKNTSHSKRNAAIVSTVIALFALSFFLGRATAPSHVSSSAQTHAQLSPANRAQIANDVAPLSNTTPQLTAANRAEIANDVAPLSPANTASCFAGRPC